MSKRLSALCVGTALALSLGCMGVSADEAERSKNYTSAVIFGCDENGVKGGFGSITDITGISAVTYTFKLDENTARKAVKGEIDFTGSLGTDSDTLGRVAHEWSFAPYQLDENGDVIYGDDLNPLTPKELTMEKIMDGYYCITLENPTGFFKDDDTYARVWFDCDSDEYDIALTGVVLSFDDSQIVRSLKNADMTLSKTSMIYTGSALKPTATVKYGKKTLKEGTDYTLSYKNNVNTGTATVTATGKGKYKGTVSKNFTVKAASVASATVALPSLTAVYTGKKITPAPTTVKVGGKTLKSGTDYTVSYSNNVNVGTASVKIKGKGNYSGSVTKTFTITPGKTTIGSATTPASGKAKVTWKKNTSGTGYQVFYSDNSTFSSAKKKVINSNTTLSATIGSLTKGKVYYFKVRAFKKVGSTYIYGPYSAVKSVKVGK